MSIEINNYRKFNILFCFGYYGRILMKNKFIYYFHIFLEGNSSIIWGIFEICSIKDGKWYLVQIIFSLILERGKYSLGHAFLLQVIPSKKEHIWCRFFRKKGNFPVSNVQFYAAEIVSALSYLHSLKIVYRNYKKKQIQPIII